MHEAQESKLRLMVALSAGRHKSSGEAMEHIAALNKEFGEENVKKALDRAKRLIMSPEEQVQQDEYIRKMVLDMATVELTEFRRYTDVVCRARYGTTLQNDRFRNMVIDNIPESWRQKSATPPRTLKDITDQYEKIHVNYLGWMGLPAHVYERGDEKPHEPVKAQAGQYAFDIETDVPSLRESPRVAWSYKFEKPIPTEDLIATAGFFRDWMDSFHSSEEYKKLLDPQVFHFDAMSGRVYEGPGLDEWNPCHIQLKTVSRLRRLPRHLKEDSPRTIYVSPDVAHRAYLRAIQKH